MLKKKNILKNKKEFDFVFKKGKSNYDKILGIKIIKNNLNYNRFGVILGKKVNKLATERNKIKRRIKAILFNEEQILKSGFDIIVIPSPMIADKDYKFIKQTIVKILKILKMY
ncbi:ribonuclease P protein component [Candidatus Parcubacteria bacterium]|nr:ribonuclease P protein component [Candidatus Parcubacteria bacterium]